MATKQTGSAPAPTPDNGTGTPAPDNGMGAAGNPQAAATAATRPGGNTPQPGKD